MAESTAHGSFTALHQEFRTSVSCAQAAIAGLQSRDIVLTNDERAELLTIAEESLVRLTTWGEALLALASPR